MRGKLMEMNRNAGADAIAGAIENVRWDQRERALMGRIDARLTRARRLLRVEPIDRVSIDLDLEAAQAEVRLWAVEDARENTRHELHVRVLRATGPALRLVPDSETEKDPSPLQTA